MRSLLIEKSFKKLRPKFRSKTIPPHKVESGSAMGIKIKKWLLQNWSRLTKKTISSRHKTNPTDTNPTPTFGPQPQTSSPPTAPPSPPPVPVVVNDTTIFLLTDPAQNTQIHHSAAILRSQGYDIRFIQPHPGCSYSPYHLNQPMQLIISDAVKLPGMWINPN